MSWIVSLILLFAGLTATTRLRLSLLTWTVIFGAGLLLLSVTGLLPALLALIVWPLFIVMALFNFTTLRQKYLSTPMLQYMQKVLPPISETERQAIEAGTTWWEADLFQGNPNYEKLLSVPEPGLSGEEQAYMDGPVENLCAMLDDWQISHELQDLPREVWEFLARERFWAINIPKQYGGLEFSAEANSAIVTKIGTRSGTAAVTVMVPNSLGPAELLLDYGTREQKDYYLPRLAAGDEIPCFGLTNPWAGSDAGSIPDHGVVCKGEYRGEEVLGLRLNWEKRYITLGPVATLLGLAFKAYDPDRLLGGEDVLGITCALIPTDLEGVRTGERHYPMDGQFQNGPNYGHDVFIPLKFVIGGEERVGKGWRMLMESLAVGRAISLPASGTAAAKLSARTTGAYARIREQFGIPIGKFEGVQEALARIGGLTYMMDAGRLLTTSALKLGERPSVITAILKYHLTENARTVVNDAMDIHGGRGICRGPANYLAQAYTQLPILITVEGANILTRSMMIFGQGSMRCHPYLLDEIKFAQSEIDATVRDDFDETLTNHIGYTAMNGIKSVVYGVSGSRLAPGGDGPMDSYYRQFARYSASFALLADITLLMLGGEFKRKESLSARFGDALSHMYLGTASLKRFKDHGEIEADRPLAEWACRHSLHRIQIALDGILRNFPVRSLAVLLRGVVFPLGRCRHEPSDRLGHQVAELLLEPSESRDRLTAGIDRKSTSDDVTGSLEDALGKVVQAEPLLKKLKEQGHRFEPAPDNAYTDWVDELVSEELISRSEAEVLRAARDATLRVIAVDDFPPHTTLSGRETGTSHEDNGGSGDDQGGDGDEAA
ncbi:MAG: Acyl-coenzyme A dehydrogenase [Gammaproteobacteria bacterium]|nr:Acyl-coenzyme A dehydrogenase [Gammaproteobacteria bacterium]